MSIEIDEQLLLVIQDTFGAYLTVELKSSITKAIQLRTLARAIETINCANSMTEKAIAITQRAYDDPKVFRTRIKCACFPGQGATLTPEEKTLLSDLDDDARQLRADLGSFPQMKQEIDCLLSILKRIEDCQGHDLNTKQEDIVSKAKEMCQMILSTLERSHESAIEAVDMAEWACDPQIFHAKLKHAYGMPLSPEEKTRTGYFKDNK